MSIELGETLVVGENNTGVKENKPLKAFHKLSEMKAGEMIEGIYQGKFESKKLAGSFFHVFKQKDGEGHAYGDNKYLEEKITLVKSKALELGLNEKSVYAMITFNGKVTGKAGRSYYSFSNPTLVKVKEENTITTTDVPF